MQTVLITGASRGIGAATAKAFAQTGYRVVINYRSDEAGARETAAQIQSNGGVALLAQADVADPMACAQLLASVGSVDVLINNAAQFDRESFVDAKLEDVQRVLNANVMGPFALSQLVTRDLIARGQAGAIIHISSVLAQHAFENRSAYIASKGAVEALTRAMAIELARYRIRVNCIAPGLIATEALLVALQDPHALAATKELIPFGRLGQPEEIAEVALFLASPAARYITGAIVPVDGGVAARESSPRA
jgi:glucose 1-dehydrogenase